MIIVCQHFGIHPEVAVPITVYDNFIDSIKIPDCTTSAQTKGRSITAFGGLKGFSRYENRAIHGLVGGEWIERLREEIAAVQRFKAEIEIIGRLRIRRKHAEFDFSLFHLQRFI